ncbi:MAG: BON domain-containing protein [Thermodesulfobacteriota bacterium]
MALTDEQIKKDIVDELSWDTRIDASKVSVTVDDGIVKLSGEVPSYRDIVAARDIAWSIPGVIDLKDDLLATYPSPPEIPTDLEIERRANETLIWDTALDETKVKASVTDGMVTLKGTVDTHWKKTYAEDRIYGIRGVIAIDNQLAVVPTKTYLDESVAEDVVSAIDRDLLVDVNQVTVQVTDGVVKLSGTVPSWTMLTAAEEDASRTAGVIDVQNELRIAA